jgi:F-type H+-transporting ATPase subunit b
MTETDRFSVGACETWRKLRALVAAIVFAGAMAAVVRADDGEATAAATRASAGTQHDAPKAAPVSEEAVAEGHTGEEPHGESVWAFAGKIVNFALLAGTLVYFLRAPIAGYLSRRSSQIRSDLTTAEEMKQAASRQIAEIDAKLQQLPGELEALRRRGADEIATEEARIQNEAERERQRLLEQTRREIDLQLRIARRDLVSHAADLAVNVARDRIRRQITDADQRRLVDRYLEKVSAHD